MAALTSRLTTDEWLELVGLRLRAARVRAEMEQTELAALANVSVGTIKNLESGAGTSLRSLINVLRGLDLLSVLEALPPENMPSPLQILKTQKATHLPSRVVKSRRKQR
jgi:transcriptional regulator with XRE-family HTH domain